MALVAIIMFLAVSIASGQYTSKDDYTGLWDVNSSWIDDSAPGTNNIGSRVNIYGSITREGNLDFGNGGDLHIYDTLIVKGDVSHHTNNDLVLHENSVLIIYGNLLMGTRVDINSNGTLIVTGNLEKSGADNQGSFTVGDQDPPQVYIGGTISDNIANNDNFPALDCSDDGGSHNSSGCSYGDLNDVLDSDYGDLVNDNNDHCIESSPVINSVDSNSPVDLDGNLELTGSAESGNGGDVSYSWVGPENFYFSGQTAEREITSEDMGGYYVLRAVNSEGCSAKDSVNVLVGYICPAPVAEISVDPVGSVCETNPVEISISFTGSGIYSFTLIRTHEVEGEEAEVVLATETNYEGSNYTFNSDSPEWVDSGVRPAEATQYTYSLRDFEDENCAGSFTEANLEVWKLPETGPQYHISNSFGAD